MGEDENHENNVTIVDAPKLSKRKFVKEPSKVYDYPRLEKEESTKNDFKIFLNPPIFTSEMEENKGTWAKPPTNPKKKNSSKN